MAISNLTKEAVGAALDILRQIPKFPADDEQYCQTVTELMKQRCKGGVRFGQTLTPDQQVQFIARRAAAQMRFWSLADLALIIEGSFSPYPRA